MLDEETTERIFKIHRLIPPRRVTLVNLTYTLEKGWIRNDKLFESLKGAEGIVTDVHPRILEAVKVDFSIDGKDPIYWHYLDLELKNEKDIKVSPVIVHFDPTFIDF